MGYMNDVNVKSLELWPMATQGEQQGQSAGGCSMDVAHAELRRLQLC